jgi:hypothetical protein
MPIAVESRVDEECVTGTLELRSILVGCGSSVEDTPHGSDTWLASSGDGVEYEAQIGNLAATTGEKIVHNELEMPQRERGGEVHNSPREPGDP